MLCLWQWASLGTQGSSCHVCVHYAGWFFAENTEGLACIIVVTAHVLSVVYIVATEELA